MWGKWWLTVGLLGGRLNAQRTVKLLHVKVLKEESGMHFTLSERNILTSLTIMALWLCLQKNGLTWPKLSTCVSTCFQSQLLVFHRKKTNGLYQSILKATSIGPIDNIMKLLTIAYMFTTYISITMFLTPQFHLFRKGA